ncbi:MAG: hypothetical protein AAF387_09300 [Pseudomonadota bacterium]
MHIEFDQVSRSYITIDEAKKQSGLRILLPEIAVPGPWFESCKGIFYVKGLEFIAVKGSNPGTPGIAIGMNDTQSQLVEWTGQSSLPVVVWNDELPRSHWIAQLHLAERLQAEPALIPSNAEDRIRMFGLANELMGENGMVWDYRLTMVPAGINAPGATPEQQALFRFLGDKYGYTEETGKHAMQRVCERITMMDAQLSAQKARGSKFLIGDTFSALDIYWACACGLISPMDDARCPMATGMRSAYGQLDEASDAALSDALIAHRDFIYEEYLELPIVF